jgi:PAS domain S-box-containing protein
MNDESSSREQLLRHVRSLRERLSSLERAEAEIGALARHQAAVTQIGLCALGGGDPIALMREAATRVAEALAVTHCAVLERVSGGRHLLLRAGCGFKDGWIGRTIPTGAADGRPRRGQPLADQVMFEELKTGGRGRPPELLVEHRVTSGMSVTIPGRDGPFGTLGAYATEPRRFTTHDLNFLQAVAGILAAAVERRGAEEALRESEGRFRAFMDNSPSVAFMKDAGGRYVYSNTVYARVFRTRPEDLIGRTDFDQFPETIARQLRANDQAVLAGDRPVELMESVPTPDGVLRHWLVFKFPVGDRSGRRFLGGVAIDLTERMRAQEELRAGKAAVHLLQAVAVAANDAVHPEDAMQVALDGICAHTGWPVGHVYLVSESSPDLLLPADVWHLDDASRYGTFREVTMAQPLARGAGLPGRVLESGGPVWIIDVLKEAKFPRAKPATDIGVRAGFGFPILVGKEVAGVLEFFAPEAREPDDALLRVMSQIGTQLGRVIERRRARLALDDEKERLAVTLRSIGDAVITTDVAGRVVLANRAAEALTGWGLTEAAGRPLVEVLQLIDPKTRDPVRDPAREALAPTGGDAESRSALLVGRDGAERLIAFNVAPIRHAEGDPLGAVVVFRDITRQRRTEEEMLKTSKLESVGVLAGGIAHDFNNVLTAVLGNILLARMDLPPEGAAARRLAEAEQACLRAKDLTQQLLTFARGGDPIRKTVSIGDLVRESANLALRGTNARSELHLPDDLWPVDVDPGQMAQVFNHLVVNARQAMPDGGVVRIRAANMPPAPPDRRHRSALPPEARVRITVEDHGAGIPEEHLSRIFDPYFSTKEQGSGLGLAIAHSVIAKHGGRIAVESRVGIGTAFLIDLPAARPRPGASVPEALADAGRETAPARTGEAPGRGKARILVMDDERPVKEVLGAILGHFGYEPDFARDGLEALEIYRAARDSGRPFDAVILDLTIPGGMGGKETIRRLLEIDPEVRAIVASGYSDDPVMADYRRYGFRGVVPKPFRFEELREVLERVLRPAGG